MGSPLCIRLARIEEASALLELCVRSKAAWGYDEDFMGLVRLAFEGMQEQIATGNVWAATDADGEVVGMVALGPGEPSDTLDLDKLFVEPRRIRTGVGRALLTRAIIEARLRGAPAADDPRRSLRRGFLRAQRRAADRRGAIRRDPRPITAAL